jgi:glutamate synthase (ferredoxin)
LPPGSLRAEFQGAAGQSFGAFTNHGMHLRLIGEAQDYVGKGMAGGEIAVLPPADTTRAPDDNVIVGNTVLYGATGGSLYAAGKAGERLCVRNSGARAVVEGCGDHGCEYMTGGVAVVLGRTGRNFGAGMSGGIAFVLDDDGDFADRINPGMVRVLALSGSVEERLLKALLERHLTLTGSPLAQALLGSWPEARTRFVRVEPHPSLEDATAREQQASQLEETMLAQVQADAAAYA